MAPDQHKARKPIDPPPVVELDVQRAQDPERHFLYNPFLSLRASLRRTDHDQPVPGYDALAGTVITSLQLLKEKERIESGLFVFGDISVREQGSFRLHFEMWEYDPSDCHATFLASCTSQPFSVFAPKDFQGMMQSTLLTRNMIDCGIRVPLRKLDRKTAGTKRKCSFGSYGTIFDADVCSGAKYLSHSDDLLAHTGRESTNTLSNQTTLSIDLVARQSFYTCFHRNCFCLAYP